LSTKQSTQEENNSCSMVTETETMEKKISSPDFASFERAFNTAGEEVQDSTDHKLAEGVTEFFSPNNAKPIQKTNSSGAGFGNAFDDFLDIQPKEEDNSEEHKKIDTILHSFEKKSEKVEQ
jgi:hypothetical protein